MSDTWPPEFYQAVVEGSPDAVIIVDRDGRIVFAGGCGALLGYAPGDLLGRSVELLVPPEFARHPDQRLEYVKDAVTRSMGRRPTITALTKSGATVPVDIALSPLPPVPGFGPLFQAAIRDALPRSTAQQELLVQSVAMDAAANGIVITDPSGIIRWVNPAVTRMTGYAADELVGRHTRLLKSGEHDAAFYRELWESITAGRAWFGEMANRRKDGSIYFEEQHIAPVHDDTGAITHFIAIKQDVTERRVAEQQLRHVNAELTRRLGEIEALHELLREQAVRDPLTNLFNRRYMEETLRREMQRAQRSGAGLAVVLIDVDGFKHTNDTLGHAAGDETLKALGALLVGRSRGDDVACRLGGDEFLVVLPGAPLAVAEQRGDALRRAALGDGGPDGRGAGPAICALSVGVTALRSSGDTPALLLKRADDALYQAKEAGRNRVVAVA